MPASSSIGDRLRGAWGAVVVLLSGRRLPRILSHAFQITRILGVARMGGRGCRTHALSGLGPPSPEPGWLERDPLMHLHHATASAVPETRSGRKDGLTTMTNRDVTIAVVGSGGDGVVTLGDLVAQVAAREGLHVIKTEAYGPQIRGGESSCTVRVAAEEIFAQGDERRRARRLPLGGLRALPGRDLGVAGRARSLRRRPRSDPARRGPRPRSAARSLALDPGPFAELSRTSSGTPGSKNVVTLGILGELLGLPAETPEARAGAPLRAQEGVRARGQRAGVRGRTGVRGVAERRPSRPGASTTRRRRPGS